MATPSVIGDTPLDKPIRSMRASLVNSIVIVFFIVCAWIYAAQYFPLDENRAGGPGEFVSGVAIQWFVADTVGRFGEFPLWNPYIRTGLPYIGNPYISMFNPFVLVPLGLLGPTNGAKVAVVLSMAMAGSGQYWLGRVLGHGRTVALASGVLALCAGSILAPVGSGFSFAAPIQHAWIAAVLASFIMVLERRSPRNLAIAAMCSAVMFMTGFLYYWIGIGFILIVFIVAEIVKKSGNILAAIESVKHNGITLSAYAALTALLIAPQFLPLVELMPYIEKPMDVSGSGTLPPLVTLFGFVVPDRQFWANGLFGASPIGWAIYYSYIGATIFIFAPFAVGAYLRGRTRYLPHLLASFFAMIILSSIHKTSFKLLLDVFSFMQQFRFWGSLVAVATIVLIPLLMGGADWLWKAIVAKSLPADISLPDWRFQVVTGTSGGDTQEVARTRQFNLARAGVTAGVVIALLAAVADPWQANKGILNTPPWNRSESEVFSWVRSQEPGALLINANSMIYSLASSSQMSNELTVIDSVFPMKLRANRVPTKDILTPAPRYALILPNAPTNGQMKPIRQFSGGWVYGLPLGLPFAFVARDGKVPFGPVEVGTSAVASGDVIEARASFKGPNRIVVKVPTPAWTTATEGPGQGVVVMQGWMPGWRARSESGQVRLVRPVGEFIEIVGAQPGETVILNYLPTSFVIGSVLGFLGLGIFTVFLVVPEASLNSLFVQFKSRLLALQVLGHTLPDKGPDDDDDVRGPSMPVPLPPRPSNDRMA